MRISLCNEVLRPLSFEAQCKVAAAMGYDGLELAPFTLDDDPQTLTEKRMTDFAHIARDHGLTLDGLHWLLVKPANLSITAPDEALRARTIDWMRRLCALCAAAGGRYLVHGSPAQRLVDPGESVATAIGRARDAFAAAGEAARACGVTYCIEPLSSDQTPVINKVSEAVSIVQEVGNPALRTMIDTSSAGLAEIEPVDDLVRRWVPTGMIAHVQFNDPNRRGPGQGAMRFAPVLRALRDTKYAGIVAVEPFDYQPDGHACAARAIGYLRGLMEAAR